MKKKNIAIILSGGIGKRFNGEVPKQFYKIGDKTILEHSLINILELKFYKIIVVSHKSIIHLTKSNFKDKKIIVINGGKNRQDSVKNALLAIKKFKPDNVIIHDAVRPFYSKELLIKIVKKLNTSYSAVPVLRVHDSLRYLNKQKYKNIERDNIFTIQTPQGFNYKKIFNAYKNLDKIYTDDSMIAFENNIKINTIEGERDNIKITTKNDYDYAKKKIMKKTLNIRIGQGFDVHNLIPGKYLILCGIKIPYSKKLEGHSDADVGFHCIVDSILGAIGKGDIGEHFPPSEQKWKDKPSIFFMNYTKNLLIQKKFQINNLDLTLICEKPKLTKYKEKMKLSISKALLLDKEKINIKATTTEKLGFVGRQEGIACQSVVSVSELDE
ncbi:MAG: 2-C-methyl-D-erythritol 2,4-cyclodiphosphate synthase [Rickettsiales bacterium]|nr:2-C-methyl-D-erythritol 2,4-cyclodiphosphate synthase [Rickettsiales bacterium]